MQIHFLFLLLTQVLVSSAAHFPSATPAFIQTRTDLSRRDILAVEDCMSNRLIILYSEVQGKSIDDSDKKDNSYKSKSTATPDAASEFYEGSDQRRERLHRALQEIGISITDDLLESAEFRGSAALRTYNSFLLPKSKGALAIAKQPQRASVVANNISFLVGQE
jgi:hypothetical protein